MRGNFLLHVYLTVYLLIEILVLQPAQIHLHRHCVEVISLCMHPCISLYVYHVVLNMEELKMRLRSSMDIM